MGHIVRYDQEPIAALATSQGRSAIAIIRLSGDGTWQLLAKSIKGCLSIKPRMSTLRKFRDPDSGVIIDELLLVLFEAKSSFSGQESAELYCHGGPFIVQRLLETLYRSGFRAADPGEFTRRAYLNGRIDLTTAEGIKELVNADSEHQWKAAKTLAEGHLHRRVEELRRLLVEAMAYLEACIDFPDEGETANLSIRKDVVARVERARAAIEKLSASYTDGKIASEGLLVALIGEPNSGKSTLLNTVLGRARAIVTDIPGTTRDFIEEKVLIKGRLIRLVDTAGIRESHDQVEKLGIKSSREFIEQADLVLLLVPADAGPRQKAEAFSWIAGVGSEKVLTVRTKSDLAKSVSISPSEHLISCHTGQGIDALTEALTARVDRSAATIEADVFVTTARHKFALDQALGALRKFDEELQRGNFEECLAFELQQGAKSLRSLVGEIGSEDLLDKIFSDFCIGK